MESFEVIPFAPAFATDIARLWDQEHPGTGEAWLRRFRWQYLDNPAKESENDMGIVLRNAEGRVVGSKLWMPQWFKVLDTTARIRVSTDTIVDRALRGQRQGLRLILAYFHEHANLFVLSTSIGQRHARIWQKANGRFVPGTDRRHIVMLRPARFFALRYARRSPRLGRGVICSFASILWKAWYGQRWRRTGGQFVACGVSAEDPLLGVVWDESKGSYPITSIRNRAYMTWRHGHGGSRVVLVSRSNGEPASFFAFKPLQDDGNGVRRACVLDAFGPVAPDIVNSVLGAFLRFLADEGYDVVDVIGLSTNWQCALRKMGARCWKADSPFFFLAGKDPIRQSAAADWHLVCADGDGGFCNDPMFMTTDTIHAV